MIVEVDQTIPVARGYAAERTRGLYNVDAEDGARFRLTAEVPVEETDWQIGVVVGPSGSGKSSILRALAAEGWHEWTGGRWSRTDPIIEVLGAKDYAKATAALAAVGLGSVPSWLRPHRVLSNGEQFRAEMAQLLLSGKDQVLLDEFTSVLDRTVAQVAAGAFARSWRKVEGRRIVLFTPHYDILDWVQPDWIVNTAAEESLEGNRAALARGCLQSEWVVRRGFEGEVIGRVRC